MGSLNSSGTITPASLLQTDQWNLDLLGNWTGTSTVGGRVTTTSSGTTNFGYDVDQRNRITSIKTGGAGAATAVRYDASGNLQFDGTYFYQYDAWNRLIQVNLGLWESGGTIAIGALVKNYAYDGLGRLVRTLSPYPNPAAGGTFNRAERFYYDGIRRIQEVFTDPILSSGGAEGSGDSGTEQLAEETTPPDGDKQGTPLGLEAGLTGASQVHQWLDREYVWGPGDGPGGVDELLVQYDNQRVPWWVIQDEGGDVAALCDLGAASADGRVVGQYTYDAYGSPLSFDYLHAHPQMRCGHKGLFVDRLDVGVVLAGNVESTRITPGATIICHNRNRTYSPRLGRFLQQDPNASGEVLIDVLACEGGRIVNIPGPIDMQSLWENGASLYQYLGSQPAKRSDPCGLSWEEDFQGVLLGLVTLGDGLLPVSMVGPLDELLQGLYLMVKVHTFIQGSAYDEEELFDWALDMHRSDDEYYSFPRRTLGPPPPDPASSLDENGPGSLLPMAALVTKGGLRPHISGRSGVRAAAKEFGSVKAKRISWESKNGTSHSRNLDQFVETSQTYLEVKAGKQGLTERALRQIRRDAVIRGRMEKNIEWVLYYREKESEISSTLVKTLENYGFKPIIRKLPR